MALPIINAALITILVIWGIAVEWRCWRLKSTIDSNTRVLGAMAGWESSPTWTTMKQSVGKLLEDVEHIKTKLGIAQ